MSTKTSSPKRSAIRTLNVLVVIIVAMVALIAGLAKWGDGQWTPRLGLDLEGGTEMVLVPVLSDNSTVDPGHLNQAVEIIRQRIDANGVAESEISTQGGENIVVSIPGKPTKEQLDAISKPSQLRFRAVFVQSYDENAPGAQTPQVNPKPTVTPTGTATTTGTASPTATGTSTAANAPVPQALAADTATPTATGTATPTATGTPTPTPEATPTVDKAAIEASVKAQAVTGLTMLGWDKTKADEAAAKVATEYTALSCSKPGALEAVPDARDLPMATCGTDGITKYVLGPVEIDGSDIADASSGFQTGPTGQPTTIVEVRLQFKDAGKQAFADVTKRLVGQASNPPFNQFAIVLDKQVLSAPSAEAIISDGRASITGNFTIDSAQELAQQLKFGALPMSFSLQTQNDITPQLGQEQLRLGLIAGLIGMLLVFAYSFFQYRALGFVTVVSLIVAAILSYLAVVILGTTHGFRLTMAGVTGLIVAIGITADSFIVYFERIRDEVREGRPLVAAVETGWKRARRTILAGDAVNFIAAVVLYLLASANVRGFAFTLGLTTIIDLAVVMLFTHPTVRLLARTKFFGEGHRWSGLDPERLGAKESPRYRGRGQFGPAPTAAPEPVATARLAEGKAQA